MFHPIWNKHLRDTWQLFSADPTVLCHPWIMVGVSLEHLPSIGEESVAVLLTPSSWEGGSPASACTPRQFTLTVYHWHWGSMGILMHHSHKV